MKYPTCILKGDYAKGRCVSIATSGKNMIQDTGAKMIHLGKHTKSEIISKTIVNEGGEANYRGLVKITKSATDAYAQVTCDSLILDNFSRSDTIPTEIIENNTSFIKHEAKVTDIDKEKKFFLNSRGVDDKQARLLSTLGFIKPFSDELPLEYSVEFNRLLKVLIK
jgi:Fe-S cluster assembly protein SufB